MVSQVLTDVGEAWVVSKLVAADEAKYIQWGIGTTAAAKTDTAIQTTTGAVESRATATLSAVTDDGAEQDTYQAVGQLTKASTGAAITEAALFTTAGSGNPPTGGTCVLRGVFDPINLAVGDKIEFTFKLTIA
jgi:hypothetical protein